MKTKYSKASETGGRKIPKTLSGIETDGTDQPVFIRSAGKYLKPYQGLKQTVTRILVAGSLWPENT